MNRLNDDAGPLLLIAALLVVATVLFTGLWIADRRLARAQVQDLVMAQMDYHDRHGSFLPDTVVRRQHGGNFWVQLTEYEVTDYSWSAEYRTRTNHRVRYENNDGR